MSFVRPYLCWESYIYTLRIINDQFSQVSMEFQQKNNAVSSYREKLAWPSLCPWL